MHFMYCDLGYANVKNTIFDPHVTHRETDKRVQPRTQGGGPIMTHGRPCGTPQKYKSDIYFLKYTPEVIF